MGGKGTGVVGRGRRMWREGGLLPNWRERPVGLKLLTERILYRPLAGVRRCIERSAVAMRRLPNDALADPAV